MAGPDEVTFVSRGAYLCRRVRGLWTKIRDSRCSSPPMMCSTLGPRAPARTAGDQTSFVTFHHGERGATMVGKPHENHVEEARLIMRSVPSG